MNRVIKDFFLAKIKDTDYIVQQKALFLVYFNFIIIVISICLIIIGEAGFNFQKNGLFLFSVFSILICLIDLILIRAGWPVLACNLITIMLAIDLLAPTVIKVAQSPEAINAASLRIAPNYFYYMFLAVAAFFSTGFIFLLLALCAVIFNVEFFILISNLISNLISDPGIFIEKQSMPGYLLSALVLSIIFYILIRIYESGLNISAEKITENGEQYSKIFSSLNSIEDTSLQLASSSNELSMTASSFSENAQTQAASAEEITATIEEITAGMESIFNSADYQNKSMESLIAKMIEFSKIITETQKNISDTLSLTSGIMEHVKTGNQSLTAMASSMSTIGASSGEMSSIIKMINDISDQINLLSLNAAIEAARAGNAGRGFAVVADEISKLADKTTDSVNNISSLIKSNEREINNGKSSVKKTTDTIGSILKSVNTIAEMMDKINGQMNRQLDANKIINQETVKVKEKSEEIKSATEEQKIASHEMVRSIASVNEVAQSNASGSEEISANSEEIASTAEKLKEIVTNFKSGNN
jgi:methyl-accepting chemotaxis protein